jgi:hypothetical protein
MQPWMSVSWHSMLDNDITCSFMEHRPFWEANSRPVIRNPPPPPPVLKNLPLDHIRSQITIIQTLIIYSFKIHLNISSSCTPNSSKWSRLFTVLFTLKCCRSLCFFQQSHTCYMPCSFHLLRFGHQNIILWGIQIMKHLIMQRSSSSVRSRPSQYPFLRHPHSIYNMQICSFNVGSQVLTAVLRLRCPCIWCRVVR